MSGSLLASSGAGPARGRSRKLRAPCRAAALLGLLLPLACGATPKRPEEPPGPDAKALAMETLVKARSVEIILSVRWRKMAKVEGIRVDEATPGTQVVRGSAVVAIDHLRVEAEEVTVKWLAEAHYDLLVCARDVTLFRQVRGQPYETKDLAMITVANDQVTFLR